jgi:hypothetical protein
MKANVYFMVTLYCRIYLLYEHILSSKSTQIPCYLKFGPQICISSIPEAPPWGTESLTCILTRSPGNVHVQRLKSLAEGKANGAF